MKLPLMPPQHKISSGILTEMQEHKGAIAKIARGQPTPPISLEVDLEGYCPHDCLWCTYRHADWDKHGMQFLKPAWVKLPQKNREGIGRPIEGVSSLPREVALSIPEQMQECGIPEIVISGGGESTVYRHFADFLKEVRKFDLETVIYTNGQYINKHIGLLADLSIEYIRFSVDAASPETYNQVHGSAADFNKVVRNIRQFLRVTNNSKRVGVSFILHPENYHEILRAAEFWHDQGIHYLRFAWVGNADMNLWMSQEQANSAQKLLEEAKSKYPNFITITPFIRYTTSPNNTFKFCGTQFLTWCVGYDAKVYTCHVQKYFPQYAFGDLRTERLYDIIHGEKRQEFVEQFDVTKCRPCWLHEKNKAIEVIAAENG